MIDQETLEKIALAYQEAAECWQKIMDAWAEAMPGILREMEQLGEALRKAFAPAAESLRQVLEEIQAGTIYKPREKLPRPPRYAGPQNKGRAWNRQPPRLARSCCRKMRR